MDQHSDLATLRQAALRVGMEALDEAEDIVPAAAVEAADVVPQLVEDLVHLEGGGDGLDEDGAADAAVGQAQALLGVGEDVVPQPGLQMALQLGQVEIGSAAPGQQLLGIVEEVEAEVEEGAGHGLAVHLHMLFGQGPAPGTHDEGGQGVVEPVVLALGTLEGQGAADGVGEVLLALQGGAPGGAVGVLEVRHETLGAGVEGVDDHLAVHGPGDLHPAVLEIGRQRRHRPGTLAHRACGREEVEALAPIELRLTRPTPGVELVDLGAEAVDEVAHEGQRRLGEDDVGPHHLGPRTWTGAAQRHESKICGAPR
jgi:hypothetical protein